MNHKERIEALKKKKILNDTQAQELSDILEDEVDIDDIHYENTKNNFNWKYTVFFIVIILIAMTLYIHNSLVKKSEIVDMEWSQVESTMQRKLDLIPNLVKVVKSYAKHESELLTQITSLRANTNNTLHAKDIAKLAKLNTKLNTSMMQLFAVAENYPDLKSSEHFLQLQAQIEGSENRINITRMTFNNAVGVYNSAIRKIPHKFIANFIGLKMREYFKVEKQAYEKFKLGI